MDLIRTFLDLTWGRNISITRFDRPRPKECRIERLKCSSDRTVHALLGTYDDHRDEDFF